MKRMTGRLASVVLCFVLGLHGTCLAAGTTCSTAISLTVEPAAFQVVLPTTVAIHVDGDGNVSVGQGGSIVNNSAGPVTVTDVSARALDGWELAGWDSEMPMDSRRIALELSGVPFGMDGSYDVGGSAWADGNPIPSGGSMEQAWDAQVSMSTSAIMATDVVRITYVVSMGDAEPDVPVHIDRTWDEVNTKYIDPERPDTCCEAKGLSHDFVSIGENPYGLAPESLVCSICGHSAVLLHQDPGWDPETHLTEGKQYDFCCGKNGIEHVYGDIKIDGFVQLEDYSVCVVCGCMYENYVVDPDWPEMEWP